MRRTLVFCVVALAVAAPATAAPPPSGIVRPDNEGALSLQELGAQLYAGNCSSCHGSGGRGVYSTPQQGAGDVEGLGPPLRGVGALAADFYLRTGYMPLAEPGNQPQRSRVLFTPREIDALVAYVASLGAGPQVPDPHPEEGSLAGGLKLFTEHCAGCHQVVAEGGYVTDARVPPLDGVSAVQIAEAVRVGPYVMPKFGEKSISNDDLNSIIRYVQEAQNPQDPGGWGIGHIGPVPEGMVAWLLAGSALVLVCGLLGKRIKR